MAASPQRPRGGDGEMGALHRDALYEVLLRVPAKPLCRLRAVCRSWRSLLSVPSPFVAAHAALRRDQPPLLAVCSDDHNRAEIRLLDTSGQVVRRFDAGRSSLLRRVWPHLDLVLIVRSVYGRSRPLSVLDPATGAVSLLPGGYDNNDIHIIRSSFVFGRAAASDDGGEYKVLSLSTCRWYPSRVCKILTVDGGGGSHGKWRDTPAPPVAIETFDWDTLVASGVVYHLVDSSNGWTIAAFDLEAEQWLPDLLHGPAEPVPPAPSIVGSRERRNLAEVNGRLAAVYSTDSAMDLWLLMGSSDKVQWCKRCRVVTSSMKWYYWLNADPVPLWLLDDGRVAFWMRSRLASNGTLWMYDPRTETCTHLSNRLKIGASVYAGNLLRQQVQYAHGMEDL